MWVPFPFRLLEGVAPVERYVVDALSLSLRSVKTPRFSVLDPPPPLTEELETDWRAEEWSDTPSHEGPSQLHPSAGNERTPVGDSLNGLICN